MKCPLCQCDHAELWSQDKFRSYYRCKNCKLLFVPSSEHLTFAEEKARYDTHHNEPNNPLYRAYLQNIVDQILPHLNSGEVGLDFGCGESVLLGDLFKEKKIELDSYDLYYHPHEKIWQKSYDFIILSEVIEHLRQPFETMIELKKILRPGGQVFIKTKMYPDTKTGFDQWFYKRDLTHIIFFNQQSFEFLAKNWNMEHLYLGDDLHHLRSS